MSDQESKETSSEQEIIYEGHAIPKILRWSYVIFIVWAIYAIGKYVMPDLSLWLSK